MAVWSLERKCSETAVCLEMLVCLSAVLRCSLKRSLTVALYHVNDVFKVARHGDAHGG